MKLASPHSLAAVSALDLCIVLLAVGFALLGAARGLLVSAATLVGFALGAAAGGRLAPLLLDEGARSPYAPVVALAGAVVIGAVLAATLEIGAFRVRERLRSQWLRAADALLGSVAGAAFALLLAWVVGALLVQAPGLELRREVQRSTVLRALNERLPPSGPVLNALRRFEPLPQIAGPQPNLDPPDRAVARDPQVRGAAASAVKVRGSACGIGVAGSGWIARDGLVVTNAHVVAGQEETTVQVAGEGPDLPATAVAFVPDDDLAVLAVDGLGAPRLRMVDEVDDGTAAATVGFPGDGPLTVRAARAGAARSVLSQDAYGRGPVRRSIVPLRGLVERGNSGGPLVDRRGRVLGTVFAATVGGGQRGGYAVPPDRVRAALDRAADRAPVSTGPCGA